MSITRVKELTADTQSATEYDLLILNSDTLPSTTVKHTGAYAYYNSIVYPGGPGVYVPDATELRLGFWINHQWINKSGSDDLGTTVTEVYLLRANNTYVTVTYKGILSLYVDGEVKATALAKHFRSLNVWHHIGFTYKADGSGFVSLYIDGEQVLTYSGLVTGSISALYCVGSLVNSSEFWTWQRIYLDDIYVDLTPGEIDTCPPPLRFLYSVTDGAGENADFTPLGAATSYEAVDDASAPDYNTTEVFSTVNAARDVHATSPVTLPFGHTIKAAIPWVFAKNNNAGDMKLLSYLSPDYASGPNVGLVNGYTSYSTRFPFQPDGVTAWDEAAFNAAQFGYEAMI